VDRVLAHVYIVYIVKAKIHNNLSPLVKMTIYIAETLRVLVNVWMLGFGSNNKKKIGYTNVNMPKDLSISNAVTVGVRTCTLVDQNAENTLPHKRWR
jgi:tartrate dehydratase alpha subunit/fumarate hydratase class I-like protein